MESLVTSFAAIVLGSRFFEVVSGYSVLLLVVAMIRVRSRFVLDNFRND